MTKTKTTLIQKDHKKGTFCGNYWPVKRLPMTWKIMTAQIKEEIYNSLVCHGLFSKKKNNKKTKRMPGKKNWRNDLLYIHQLICKESKRNETKKYSWGIDWQRKGFCYGISNAYNRLFKNIRNIHKIPHECHEKLAGGIDSERYKLKEASSRDSISPLLFATAMIPFRKFSWVGGLKIF